MLFKVFIASFQYVNPFCVNDESAVLTVMFFTGSYFMHRWQETTSFSTSYFSQGQVLKYMYYAWQARILGLAFLNALFRKQNEESGWNTSSGKTGKHEDPDSLEHAILTLPTTLNRYKCIYAMRASWASTICSHIQAQHPQPRRTKKNWVWERLVRESASSDLASLKSVKESRSIVVITCDWTAASAKWPTLRKNR